MYVTTPSPLSSLVALIFGQQGIPEQMQVGALWIAAIAAGLIGLSQIHRLAVRPMWNLAHEARAAIRTVLELPQRLDHIDQRADSADERMERMEGRLKIMGDDERQLIAQRLRTGWRE